MPSPVQGLKGDASQMGSLTSGTQLQGMQGRRDAALIIKTDPAVQIYHAGCLNDQVGNGASGHASMRPGPWGLGLGFAFVLGMSSMPMHGPCATLTHQPLALTNLRRPMVYRF